MTTRSILRTGLGALVVTASLALVAPFAQASPTPSPAPTSSPAAAPDVQAKAVRTKHIDVTLSRRQSEKVLRSSLVMNHSRSGHLDWAAAKKYFGDHTTWRDDFAAGAVGAGATLDNAAQSTKDRLRTRWNDMYISPARTPLTAQRGGGTNCTGVTKDVKYTKDRGRSESWFDSCDTNAMINHYKSCTAITAFAAIITANYWAVIPGAIALGCKLNQGDVETAQQNSTVKAIKWYYSRVARVGGSGLVDGQVRITADVYSQ